MSSRRSSIVFYAIVASSEMRHTIHSVNANIENELSSPQNDRHRLHGIRCILWNGIPRNLLILHCICGNGGGGAAGGLSTAANVAAPLYASESQH